MTKLLSAAGLSFLRAFGASLIVLGPGILAAPDLDRMRLLGWAALAASLAAGLKAVVAYVPALQLGKYLGQPVGPWIDSFIQAFLGTAIVGLTGALGAPDLATGKALATAAIVGAVMAGLRALEGLATPGNSPAPASGVKPPPPPPVPPPAG